MRVVRQRLVDLRAFAPSALMAIDGAPPALLDGAPSARLPESEAGVESEVGVESELHRNRCLANPAVVHFAKRLN